MQILASSFYKMVGKKQIYLPVIYTLLLTLPIKTHASEGLSLAKIIKRPALEWPVDCTVNKDCWIYNYVDMGLDDDIGTDSQCLNRSYDNHKGTDIAIATDSEWQSGIDVLASADGVIKRTRDGEAEGWWNGAELEAIKEQRKECGNAILIDHGDGLETIYCHLKKGSLSVKKGQRVKAGQKIGQIGLSGYTEFPHLHFGVLLEGQILDPFTGLPNTTECGQHKTRLWSQNVNAQYEPLTLHKGGFTDKVPALNDVYKADFKQERLSQSIDKLVFWFNYMGARQGDEITIEILDPNLKPFAKRIITQDKSRATQLYYTGKRLREKNLQPGAYLATVTIKRPRSSDAKQDVTELGGNKGQDYQTWKLTRSVTILP